MAWRTFLALGIVSSFAAAGCTAEVKAGGSINDGGPDGATSGGASGSGGGSNTGGSKGGSGGSSGAGGAKSTGGSKSSGGTDSGPTTCDTTVANKCQKCINTNCCAEYLDCTDRCGGQDGELACIQDCLLDGLSSTPTDAGSSSLSTCADRCAQKGGNTVVSAATNAIITCVTQIAEGGTDQLCSQDCFGGPAQQ